MKEELVVIPIDDVFIFLAGPQTQKIVAFDVMSLSWSIGWTTLLQAQWKKKLSQLTLFLRKLCV
jgi:hypothetical protein